MDRLETIWAFIIDEGLATVGELLLVTAINGYKEESLNDVIYVRTGYHDMEQYIDCEMED